MVGQHVRVVLEVVSDLGKRRVLEQWLQPPQHLLAGQLVGCTGIVVGQWHVGSRARFHAEGNADDLRHHVVEAGGLGVEGHEFRRAQALQPGIESGFVGHAFVVARRCGPRGRGDRRGPVALRKLPEQGAELETAEQFAQGCHVRLARREPVQRSVEFQVAADRRQATGQLEVAEVLAQAFADLAGNLGSVLHDPVQRAVLVEPLGGRLGADLGHARDVVRAVPDQGQVVDDLLGPDVELGLHAVAVEPRAGHGVDQADPLVDQLRHVLVAGGNHRRDARLGGLAGERADDVVGLDALDAQQRQPHGGHGIEQRLDLRAQVVGHRRAVRLVLLEQLVTERPSRRVEDHGDEGGRLILEELVEHVQHAEHGAGGLAARCRQRRERMEGAIQVRRAVDEVELAVLCHASQSPVPGGGGSPFCPSSPSSSRSCDSSVAGAGGAWSGQGGSPPAWSRPRPAGTGRLSGHRRPAGRRQAGAASVVAWW